MSEAEANILELLAIATNFTLTMMQWWVSITIGLAAVGHFVGRKLNMPLTLVLLILYAGYTLYLVSTVLANGRIISSPVQR